MPNKYSGADWVARTFKIENMSPLGKAVADILGKVYQGIYHLDDKALKRVDWANDYVLIYKHDRSVSTVDFNHLTQLVVLCHDAAIRMQIGPCNFHYLELMFHQRQRDGGYSERCPTLEDHVATIRKFHAE